MAGFKPALHVSPLSSLSTIFRISRQGRRPWEGATTKIIDCWSTEKPSRYLADNTGTYHQSRGGGIYPADARPAATLLTIVDPRKQADQRSGIPKDLDTVPDEATALQAFTEHRATALSILSAIGGSPRLETRSHRWSGSFNLVVGASVTDRILFWNARLLIPAWLDADLCCWRVDLERLRDPALCAAVVQLLNARNHVNPGSGGQSQLVVRSTSHTVAELEGAASLLRAQNLWGPARTERVASLFELVPTPDDLKHAGQGQSFGAGPFRQTDWGQFVWSSPKARPPACVPDHLSDAPPRQLFAQGCWAIDYDFQLDGPAPRFAGENTWMLPRRWRMAGAFKIEHAGRRHQELRPSLRSNQTGNLVSLATLDAPVASVTVPTPREAFAHALAADGAWAKDDGEHHKASLANKVTWLTPSNEARYLDGVLGMTGGLGAAGQYLLHPFLQEMFAKMGGTPAEDASKALPTIQRLVKRAKHSPAFDLADEADREVLASLTLKAAREIKGRMEYLSFEKLQNDWISYRKAYWAANPMQGEGDPDVDWDAREQDTLDESLISMRRRKMLFQGHQWVCQRCHHRNWVDLDRLSAQPSCEVCREEVDAPVDLKWLFRPSEFLIKSLRDHSVLSLVWVLSRLSDLGRQSLIYVGPTWFGYDPESSRYDAEADLLAVVDGAAVLCEVKSSWHFPRAELNTFVELAKRLRPTRAIFAVMEHGSAHVEEFDKAKQVLAAAGIEFEVMTPKQHSHEDGPYLPSD